MAGQHINRETMLSDYRPQIAVNQHDEFCVRLPTLFAPKTPRDCWELVFDSAPELPQTVHFDGKLSEDEAVAAAQNHVLKHGWLTVKVEVTYD